MEKAISLNTGNQWAKDRLKEALAMKVTAATAAAVTTAAGKPGKNEAAAEGKRAPEKMQNLVKALGEFLEEVEEDEEA